MKIRFKDGPLIGEVREVPRDAVKKTLIFPVARNLFDGPPSGGVRTARYTVHYGDATYADPSPSVAPDPSWEPGEPLHRYGVGGVPRYMIDVVYDGWPTYASPSPPYCCPRCDVGWAESKVCWVCGEKGFLRETPDLGLF